MGWVREAGEIALERFGSVSVRPKEDQSPVTDGDYAVQDALLSAIAREYPADAVITEETQSAPEKHQAAATAQRCWVIDPIDGTRNYARSIPVFTISVALMEGGSPVVGVVYDPVTTWTYFATADGDAWLNEHRLEPRDRPASDHIFMSIATSRYEELPAVAHGWIDRMVVRNFGSTALHLALLATGGLDAVYAGRNRLWDIAAGALIAARTGAQLVSHQGHPYFPMDLARYANEPMPFIAAHPEVLNRLLAEHRQAESRT